MIIRWISHPDRPVAVAFRRRFLRSVRYCLLGLGVGLTLAGCETDGVITSVGPGAQLGLPLDPGWRIEHPLGGAEKFLDAFLLPDGQAWIVGTNGLILHRRDGQWSREWMAGSATLTAVAGKGADRLHAVGSGGTILSRRDGRWRVEESPTTAALRDVVLTNDGTAWAVGDRGAVLWRTAAGWRILRTPTTRRLHSITSWAGGVVMGGDGGTLLAYAGGQWRDLGDPSENGAAIQQVAVSDWGELFVLADMLYRHRDGTWEQVQPNRTRQTSRFALRGTELFLGLESGYVLVADVDDEDPPYSIVYSDGAPVVELCIGDGQTVLSVGFEGHIRWYTGGDWQMDVAGNLGYYTGVPLLDGSLLARTGRLVLHRQSGRWRVLCELPPDWFLYGYGSRMDGASAEDFHAMRSNGDLAHYVDGGWTTALEPSEGSFSSLLVDGEGGLWCEGEEGIYRWFGSSWILDLEKPEGSYDLNLLRNRAGEIFATGDDRLFHHDGSEWRVVETFNGADVSGMWVCAGSLDSGFYLFSSDHYFAYEAENDSLTGPLNIRLPGNFWGPLRCVYEDDHGILIGTQYPGRVFRMDATIDAADWQPVAGAVGADIRVLARADDGSLVAVTDYPARIYSYRQSSGR